MNDNTINEAIDRGHKNAVVAVTLWVCAIVGAIVIQCVKAFVHWVFD